MDSILIVTADPKSVQVIINVANKLNIRYKAINQIETAKEWLNLNSVSALFIDSRYNKSEPMALASFCWLKQPSTPVIVFNLYGEVAQKWQLLLVGVQVFEKEVFNKSIENLFKNLPDNLDQQNSHLNKKILLVEDLDSPRMIIAGYIESCGLGNVVGVADGEIALNLLKATPNDFFCVVTDLNMPNMNGIELATAIRKNPSISHLPVLVCTAYSEQESLVAALNAGVTGFLVKPLKKDLIKSELEKALRIYINRTSPRLCEAKDAQMLGATLSELQTNLYIG
ncbi:MAG: response regulator [Deltaproteobacteria bacterium]|jgi:two-component system chemotaxis response regulator CheY|nr:response regulator [Deltaproteobacteria bacterium]